MHRSLRWLLLSGVLIIGGTLGCGSDTTGPGPVNPAAQYWALTLNHHAITLATIAPYDTLQLIATPRTVTGAPITTSARPTFTSSDTSLKVDSAGLLTVHTTKTKPTITVVAKLTIGGVTGLTLVDTALVDIVAQPSVASIPVLTTFSIQPATGDSATVALNGMSNVDFLSTKALNLKVLDANNEAIPNTTYNIDYKSTNPLVATISTAGVVSAVAVGRTMLTAETTIYGVSRTDSLLFTIGWPLSAIVTINPHSVPGSDSTVGVFIYNDDTVGVGATVAWVNAFPYGGQSADVEFDDPSSAVVATTSIAIVDFFESLGPSGSGDIGVLIAPKDSIRAGLIGQYKPQYDTTNAKVRSFPAAGTVTYHSTLYGTTGVLHVQSNASIP